MLLEGRICRTSVLSELNLRRFAFSQSLSSLMQIVNPGGGNTFTLNRRNILVVFHSLFKVLLSKSYHLDANNAPDNNGIINHVKQLHKSSVSDVLVKPLSLFSSSLMRTCMRFCVWPTCTCCRVWSVCVAELWLRCSMRRTCCTCGRRQNCSGSRVWRTSAQNTWPRS